jgi:hypothetical protein
MPSQPQYLDGDEAALRKTSICRDGQPVRLSVAWLESPPLDDLLVLSVEPQAGFIHLLHNVEEIIRAYGPYHITVCELRLACDDDLCQLVNQFHGLECTLPISYVGRRGYMEIDESFFASDGVVRRLHDQTGAWYRGYSLHMSG